MKAKIGAPGFISPEKPEPEPHRSRKYRRAQQVIAAAMNRLLQEYVVLRTKIKDPEGEEMADKYSELNGRWKHFCYRWKKDPKKMKSGVEPAMNGFEERMVEMIKTMQIMEKENKVKNKNDGK